MTSKITAKQTAFAREYVRNKGNASAAYRHTYDAENMKPASIHTEASDLTLDPQIASMIERLKDEHAKKYEITIEEVVTGIREAALLSRSKEDAGNLRGSYMDLAKLGGLVIDKKHITGDDVTSLITVEFVDVGNEGTDTEEA